MALGDQFRQCGARTGVTMRQKDARLGRGKRGEPRQQIRLPRVRTEAAEGVNLRLHRDGFTIYRHFFCTVDQQASERAVALIAHNEDMGLRVPKIVPEMMQDPPGIAHAGSRHHETGTGDVVYLP